MKHWTALLLVVLTALGARAQDEPAPPKTAPIKAAEAFPEPAPVPVPPGPFDLQPCFELAVLRSETLVMRQEDVRVAQARYWQAVGAVLPKVHLLMSEQYRNNAGGGGSSTGVVDSSSGGS